MRPLAAAPLAFAGLALALSAPIEARARDGASATSATSAASRAIASTRIHEVPKNKTRRSHCAWGDCGVSEGRLPAPDPDGAVCPPETANIEDRFCIDRYEASLVEVQADGSTTPWPPFGIIDESRSLRAVSVPNVYPQAYISGAQAARACAAAGKRLCAPVEWRMACMGPRHVAFGYGSERVAGRCNDHGKSPMARVFAQGAITWGLEEMNDPRLNQLVDTLARTGSHEDCTNEYGVYDMVGNLHEWTNDPHGTFQGGYYLDTHLNGDGCTYRTVAHEMAYHDYSTGFRCCADPVPQL
jgi:hypothetical protein